MLKQIIVPTDGSDNSLAAADYAVNIAKIYNASVHGLFVKDIKILAGPLIHDIGTSIGGMVPYGTFNQTVREMLDSKADAALNQVEGKCIQAGIPFTREIQEGIVNHEIVKSSANYDLIVMGKMGIHAEWRDVFLGSNVEFVVRKTHKPVLITPPRFKPFRNMLIAFDGSLFAEKALKIGAEMAQSMNLKITLVCVDDTKDKALSILSKAKMFLSGFKLSANIVAMEGKDHAKGIQDACKDNCDLLVMGAYGHSKLQEMILGSTTVRVMRHTDCPILLYR
ncbi:MAG: universal stress protein [Planctomycetes bacterium]|nr:universal stress protein [Planctomycetota bacterium]